MILLSMLLLIPGSLVLLNLYYRKKTFKSVDKEIEKLCWHSLPENEFIQKSYHFVADRFSKVNKCWLRYPWRNIYFTNMWKMKGEGLPCHMLNILFQRFVRKKLKRKNIRTLATWSLNKGLIIHFYSRIRTRDSKWVEVDVWGKKWGIPFGRNVHNSKLH
jgi:hypothetical protein